MKRNRVFSRLACALCLALLCLMLAACGGGVPFVVRNDSGLDLTASITILRSDQTSAPLRNYLLAAGGEAQVSVPRSMITGDWHITVVDSQGRSFSFRGLPAGTPGETVQVALRYEQDQLVLAVDWGDGAELVLTPLTSAAELEDEAWQRYRRGEISYDDYLNQDFWLRLEGSSPRKRLLVFGDTDTWRYTSQEEARAHMVQISFPVWKLSGDKKVSSTATIWINQAVAQDVVDIFTEIYNDPEQFPIKSVGGYAWRGDSSSSEHNLGLAIDINPMENYQIRYGNVVVGSFWDPAASPYSIPADSSVVRIFAAHGWSWGGDAWAGFTEPSTEGNHDYMHFSYFGT